MKIIICGAGQVGRGIARRLSAEGNDVTVIDTQPDLVRTISDELDVQGIVGHAAHPDVLEEAGATDAEMFIAVTHADEVNMVACKVADALFRTPTRIARVRSQSYLQKRYQALFARENLAIDLVISPEVAVGDMVMDRLSYPGAQDVVHFAGRRVVALGVLLGEDCPVTGTPLSQLTALFPDLVAVVVAISRQGRVFIPHAQDELEPGDFIYVVTAPESARRVLHILGHEEHAARNIVIAGAGNIGRYVAERLLREQGRAHLTIIEQNRERAEAIALELGELGRPIVLHGSALDAEVLEEAEISQADLFIALTNDDKVNLLSSLLARQKGVERAMSLVSTLDSAALAAPLGVDSWIDPRAVTVSTILQYARGGYLRRIYPVFGDGGEIIEAEVLETAPIIGRKLREAEIPDGVRIGLIVRGEELIRASGDVALKPGDDVILFALADQREAVAKLFRVSLEYY